MNSLWGLLASGHPSTQAQACCMQQLMALATSNAVSTPRAASLTGASTLDDLNGCRHGHADCWSMHGTMHNPMQLMLSKGHDKAPERPPQRAHVAFINIPQYTMRLCDDDCIMRRDMQSQAAHGWPALACGVRRLVLTCFSNHR